MINILKEKVKKFEEECLKRDPGMRLELNIAGPSEYILSTINSEGTQVNYSFVVGDKHIDIARIL